MAYPVKIFKPNGKLKRIITSAMLEKRADAGLAFQITSAGFSASFVPIERKCKHCGKNFWAAIKGKKYCSKECSGKAFKINARRSAKLKKAAVPSA